MRVLRKNGCGQGTRMPFGLTCRRPSFPLRHTGKGFDRLSSNGWEIGSLSADFLADVLASVRRKHARPFKARARGRRILPIARREYSRS